MFKIGDVITNITDGKYVYTDYGAVLKVVDYHKSHNTDIAVQIIKQGGQPDSGLGTKYYVHSKYFKLVESKFKKYADRLKQI